MFSCLLDNIYKLKGVISSIEKLMITIDANNNKSSAGTRLRIFSKKERVSKLSVSSYRYCIAYTENHIYPASKKTSKRKLED
jgi:hypothetical protein